MKNLSYKFNLKTNFKQLKSRSRIQGPGLSQTSTPPLVAGLQICAFCKAVPTEGISERNYIEEQEKP